MRLRRSPPHRTLPTSMNAFHGFQPLYAASGLLVGALVGMTGVGGGSLMTPILILVFGIHPTTAVGTDLLYAAVTKTGGTLIHGIKRTIDWSIVARLAAGSIPTTALTLFILSKLNQGPTAGHLITMVLSVALFISALVLVFRHSLLRIYVTSVGELDPKWAARATIATGAILGILVSLTSVGAGALGATALVMLYPRHATVRIVGSDIAHAVPLTLLAGLGHLMMGSSDLTLLGSLLVGSLPGIALGSWAASRVPDTALRYILAVTLVIVGAKLVL